MTIQDMSYWNPNSTATGPMIRCTSPSTWDDTAPEPQP